MLLWENREVRDDGPTGGVIEKIVRNFVYWLSIAAGGWILLFA